MNIALAQKKVDLLLESIKSKGIEVKIDDNPSKEKLSFLNKYFEMKRNLFK